VKAMILAAGRGSRMQHLTKVLPKPLIPVLNKPLIQYHLDNLEQAGFTSVIINVSWLGSQLEEYLNHYYMGGLNVKIYHETHALETGGGVFSALNELSDNGNPFLVVNSDVMTDFNYADVKKEVHGMAHLYMTENPIQHPQGDFQIMEDGKLAIPSVLMKEANTPLTFSGISVLTPQLFAGCSIGKFGLAELFRKYIPKGLISGEQLHNKWIDVGTVERLALAEEWQRSLHKSRCGS
jgi:MurNAc alpha-1-phosphate uridylyltransferase